MRVNTKRMNTSFFKGNKHSFLKNFFRKKKKTKIPTNKKGITNQETDVHSAKNIPKIKHIVGRKNGVVRKNLIIPFSNYLHHLICLN